MASFDRFVLGRTALYVRLAPSSSARPHLTGLCRSLLVTFVTFLLLATNPSLESERQAPQLTLWATFLGVTSTLLAAFQYLPQIVHTWKHKVVGALSIPMMLIQTPGAILMVTSIALR